MAASPLRTRTATAPSSWRHVQGVDGAYWRPDRPDMNADLAFAYGAVASAYGAVASL